MAKHGPPKSTDRTITAADARAMVRLLGELQGHLEASIESNLDLTTNEPMRGDAEGAREVARDRRLWREAEALVKKLSGRPEKEVSSHGKKHG